MAGEIHLWWMKSLRDEIRLRRMKSIFAKAKMGL